MQTPEEPHALDKPYLPSRQERIEAALVHLFPWVNVVVYGFLGLVLTVFIWTLRRHEAPWGAHACKQVFLWQLLSALLFLVVALVLGPRLDFPVARVTLALFAAYASYGAYRSFRGALFRYPLIGRFIKPPMESDRRPLW